VVRDRLAAKHITSLLPLWRKRSLWKDRVRYVEVPLFSGYLFGHFALQEKITVLETVGVARIVGVHGTAVPMPEEQMAAVHTLVEHGLPYNPHPYLVEGMRARITRGVLTGVAGTLVAKGPRYRLVIPIELIQQAIAVEVDRADVEPLDLQPQGTSAS
jgi:transcription antitermination factor NusG